MASNIQAIRPKQGVGTWQDAYTFAYPEGASQTFKLGAPLTLTSGLAVIVTGVTSPAIAGIALAAATGVTGSPGTNNNCQVSIALPLLLYTVTVDTTTTTGTAALGTGKPSDFTLGLTYEMLLDSTSGNYYMGTGTGNPVFQLMGYDADQKSKINGRVFVRILTSQTLYT